MQSYSCLAEEGRPNWQERLVLLPLGKEHMDTKPSAGQNRLLLSLPTAERTRLERKLETVDLEFRKNLAGPDHPARHVYFLAPAMISLLTPIPYSAPASVPLT